MTISEKTDTHQIKTFFVTTGLDPALPLFTRAAPGSRISSQDAQHVEIIHTNGGLLGYMDAIGKVDFYPNGGRKQSGCLIDLGGACSHARSYELFAESIGDHAGFYGKSCDSYSSYKQGSCSGDVCQMGGHKTKLNFKGSFYLATKSRKPFAMGLF